MLQSLRTLWPITIITVSHHLPIIQTATANLQCVSACMGKMKDQILREEEAIAAAVSRRAARVAAGGGDTMGGMMAILAQMEAEAAEKGMTLEQLAMTQTEHGDLVQGDVADKELDRDGISPEQHARANEATEIMEAEQDSPAATPQVLFEMPPQDYMRKGQRFKLVFQGVCSHCAHCALKLTDAVSIERGIGPVCSKRGYFEDPKDPDEVQAMIDLAEFPDLVDYLVKHYKPQGVRGLMNGLVKVCSLNRRSPVHQACCDAVESLGYAKLASTLRESLAVVEIKDHDDKAFHLWVKKSEWTWAWNNDLRQIPGAYMSRQYKGWLIPKAQKQVLWAYMIKHFENLCATVRTGDQKKTVKITMQVKAPESRPQVSA